MILNFNCKKTTKFNRGETCVLIEMQHKRMKKVALKPMCNADKISPSNVVLELFPRLKRTFDMMDIIIG